MLPNLIESCLPNPLKMHFGLLKIKEISSIKPDDVSRESISVSKCSFGTIFFCYC
jgi:hypothetical protein